MASHLMWSNFFVDATIVHKFVAPLAGQIRGWWGPFRTSFRIVAGPAVTDFVE